MRTLSTLSPLVLLLIFSFFFFFQAEDGIRDHCVTGVQTCALPIWRPVGALPHARGSEDRQHEVGPRRDAPDPERLAEVLVVGLEAAGARRVHEPDEIGRASCRETGWSTAGGVVGRKKRDNR